MNSLPNSTLPDAPDDSTAHRRRPLRRRFNGSLRVLIVTALSAGFSLGCGPIGPLSGGRLSGAESGAPNDWKRFAGIENAQIETNPIAPYSINIWFVIVDGNAFVASSLLMGPVEPDERKWVKNVIADPQVRFRIDGVVFPARLEVVREKDLRQRIFKAYVEKYPKLDTTREGAARFYRVVSQTGTS